MPRPLELFDPDGQGFGRGAQVGAVTALYFVGCGLSQEFHGGGIDLYVHDPVAALFQNAHHEGRGIEEAAQQGVGIVSVQAGCRGWPTGWR